jgi:thiol-disulfide isomerase/thioredoxin
MSKATRNRARTARERIAVQQAAARKAEQTRRLLIVGGSVGLVIVIVVAFIVFKNMSKPGPTGHSGQLPPPVAKNITSVPDSTLSKVGTGALPASGLPVKPITDTALTSANKPEMLYIGAEFCPYCAAMRWSMAVALSKFGTFGPFTGIHSSSTDVYPNTPTLTFLNQKYTSPYLTFTPIEHQKVNSKPLQPVSKAQQALWSKYDTNSQGQVGYPFIDFGNKSIITGPLFSPQVLHGLTWAQVASKLHNPNDPVAQNVNAAANYITAAICKMTGGKPGSVCTAPQVKALAGKV